jgi:hypothetical protein
VEEPHLDDMYPLGIIIGVTKKKKKKSKKSKDVAKESTSKN